MVQSKRLNMNELLGSGLVKWKSRKTIERKIKHEGFPHIKSGQYEFDIQQVQLWFKKREKKAS